MKWSNTNKELIKQVIDRYYWMLEKKLRSGKFFGNFGDCPFCPKYHFISCSEYCPNVIITDIFNCRLYGSPYTPECIKNAKYIELKRDKEDEIRAIRSNIEKRLRFWEDALALTKKEFVRKYKH